MKIVYLPISLSTTKLVPSMLLFFFFLISENHFRLPYISFQTSNKDTSYSSFLDFLQSGKRFLDILKVNPCSLHYHQLIFFSKRPLQQSFCFFQIKAWSRTQIHSPFHKEWLEFFALRLLFRNTRSLSHTEDILAYRELWILGFFYATKKNLKMSNVSTCVGTFLPLLYRILKFNWTIISQWP